MTDTMASITARVPMMMPMVDAVCSSYESASEMLVGVEEGNALVSVALRRALAVNDVAS